MQDVLKAIVFFFLKSISLYEGYCMLKEVNARVQTASNY